MGGKATLVQSVLSALPTYCLSFYKFPKITIREIKKLQREFLWGGCEVKRKIPWVAWGDICKSKEEGGLGLKEIGVFNRALLGKWVWRVFAEENRLWVRILKSKYGSFDDWDVQGRSRRVRTKGSSWWLDLCEIYRGSIEGEGLKEELVRIVGNGKNTFFWWDRWVGDRRLKDVFPRLFNCSLLKHAKISEVGSWVEGVWSWDLKWRRGFSERNSNDVFELMMNIDRYKLSQEVEDVWRWKHAPNGIYSTKLAYKNLIKESVGTGVEAENKRKAFKILWKWWAPKKSTIIVWKAFRERLATINNLRTRGMEFSDEEAICPLCPAFPESNRHILFECPISASIWKLICSWCQVPRLLCVAPITNFLQFCGIMGRKNRAKVAATIWIGTVWSIWNARNNLVFNKVSSTAEKIADEIKLLIRSWLSIKIISVKESSCSDWLGDCRKFLGD
ncbi:hypothetical protein ACS0TY_013738 [Phlomoides rotata]